MHEKENIVLQHKFSTWIRLNSFWSFVDPLQKGHTLESNKGHHWQWEWGAL
jgi:hypothetical protein